MRTLLLALLLLGSAEMPQVAVAGTVSAPPAPAPLDSTAVATLLAHVRNGACPLPGIATGGQPDSSTLVALARGGLRTVLDLRAAEEARGFAEARVAESLGLRYVTLPVTPATLTDSTFDAFRALMREGDAESMFVHCASGNRVGVMLLPWLVLDQHWTVERATPMIEAVGLRSDEMRGRALEYILTRSPRPPSKPAQPSRKR